jgi:hypothetical protein
MIYDITFCLKYFSMFVNRISKTRLFILAIAYIYAYDVVMRGSKNGMKPYMPTDAALDVYIPLM